jgi:hypothetical protein
VPTARGVLISSPLRASFRDEADRTAFAAARVNAYRAAALSYDEPTP